MMGRANQLIHSSIINVVSQGGLNASIENAKNAAFKGVREATQSITAARNQLLKFLAADN